MGANQSQPLPNEKLVIERLRDLQVKSQEQTDDFVHVDEKAHVEKSRHFRTPWTTLSSSEIAGWEHELMQDPKNR